MKDNSQKKKAIYAVLLPLAAVVTVLFPLALLWGGAGGEWLTEIFIPVYAAIVGGGITLVGVLLTIKHNKEERNAEEIKRCFPYVKILGWDAPAGAGEAYLLNIDKPLATITKDTDQAVGVKMVGICGCIIKNLADASVIIQGFIIENHSFNLPEAALVGKNETCEIYLRYSYNQTHSGVFENCYLVVGDLLGHVYHFPCDIKCEGADNVSVSYRISNVTCVGVEFERGEL